MARGRKSAVSTASVVRSFGPSVNEVSDYFERIIRRVTAEEKAVGMKNVTTLVEGRYAEIDNAVSDEKSLLAATKVLAASYGIPTVVRWLNFASRETMRRSIAAGKDPQLTSVQQDMVKKIRALQATGFLPTANAVDMLVRSGVDSAYAHTLLAE